LEDEVYWREGSLKAMLAHQRICIVISPLSMRMKVQKREKSKSPRNHAVDHPYPILPARAPEPPCPRLDVGLVRYGCDVLWLVVLEADDRLASGLCGLALHLLGLASLLGLLLLGEVGLDALEEVLS